MDTQDQWIENALNECADSVSQDVAVEALDILFKLLSNIIGNPAEPKYKTIKPSNAVMRAKLFVMKNVDVLLMTIGFEQNAEGNYVFQATNMTPLGTTIGLAMKKQANIRTNQLSPEEKAKRAAADAEYQKKFGHEKAVQDQLKAQIEADKKENLQRAPAHDSVANKRNFGSKATTWKDIGVDLCAKGKG